MLTLWEATRWNNVNLTTPIEDPESATGTSLPIAVAGVTRTDNSGEPFAVIAAVMAATGGTVTATWPGGYTRNVDKGDIVPGLRYLGSGRETTPGAAGAVAGPSVTLNRASSAWAAINRVVRPATPGTASALIQQKIGTASTTTVTVAYTTVVVNHLLLVDLFCDDPTATITGPSGWTAGTKVSLPASGGVLQRFHRIAADSTTLSFDFTIATNTPPANTVAPVVSGTAAVGATLAVTNGTWDGATSFAYQWRADGVDISGSTSSTYVVASIDAGKTFDCRVTATNTGGSTSALSSNGIAIPNAPGNVTPPAITPAGPYHTGDTVTCNGGSWSATPTLAYQWFRGASPITGATVSSYTLVTSDEGANVFCRVTATNGGGSATADSNTIVPLVTSPISDASFLTYYSGGAGNTSAGLSIGGARGGTYPGGLNQLFGPIAGSLAATGAILYRVIYVRNTHTTATAAACKAFLETQLQHPGLELAVAVPSQAANVTVPALASETTEPAGVTWNESLTSGGGLDFGDLGPTAFRGLYVRLTISPSTTATTIGDDFSIAVEGSAA